MQIDYSTVYKHLFSYRKKLQMTQTEMGDLFGINQSHYEKLEKGNKIISYNSLKMFDKNGGDVFYLFTGREQKTGRMNEYLDRCKTEYQRRKLFELMIWLVDLGIHRWTGPESEVSEKTYKCLQLLRQGEQISVWRRIRKVENLTQIDMARLLDVNIKRYRRLEKQEVFPDGEILNTLYQLFGYSPMVILNIQTYYLDELNRIWETFPPHIRDCLENYTEAAIKLILCAEESTDDNY